VNASEALPGVVTPLTWGLYGDGTERPMRGAFADLGVLRESEAEARANPEDRLWDLFYGRPVANLNTFRALVKRPSARLTLRLAARFFPLRGVGKGAFLQCADVVRFVARAHGDHLAAEGVLADPSDVFLLTMPELLADGLPADIGEQVSLRAAQRRDYLATDLPDLWEGMPERIAVADPNAEPTNSLVTGTPVSPGVVEGIVRLVLDPAAAEPLEPDEVLVCRTTDPSWASAFMLASALVIDIGGAISHGAIVARELGIPCVIGTRTGTAALRTGDRVRVDGGRGEVHVLQRRRA
jgi:pyruvate,water dikinase